MDMLQPDESFARDPLSFMNGHMVPEEVLCEEHIRVAAKYLGISAEDEATRIVGVLKDRGMIVSSAQVEKFGECLKAMILDPAKSEDMQLFTIRLDSLENAHE